MSVLAATIADAQRPLPGRRGNVLVQRAAFEEPDPDMVEGGDSAALTVYRLQKDGANPIAPVAPTRGTEMFSRGGPSAGINRAVDAGDPGVATHHVEGRVPFVEGRNESHVRESRFASTETQVLNALSPSIPPPLRVGSSPSQTASKVSSTSDVDSQSETSRQTDQRSGWRGVARSAPSEALDDAPAASPAVRDVAARRLTDAVASGERALAVDAGTAGARVVMAEGAAHVDVPVFADAVVEATHAAARAPRDAGIGDVRPQHAASSRAAPPLASDNGAPHVHIGRIDVTVLADAPAPGASARGSADDDQRHFLSRHYLRRP